jgi:hypothetical protein
MGEQATPRLAMSVETGHLTNAATRYDSTSTSVNNMLNSFLQLEDDLATACGNDETGQKIHSSIANIKHSLVKDIQLFAEVTGLTGDGIRDMRDVYEQAETNAELIARGVNPEQKIGSAPPNTGQNQNNSPNTNTSSGNGRKH